MGTIYRAAATELLSGNGWNNAKAGAGGLVTGVDLALDGTFVCRTDAFGAYRYDRTAPNPGNAGGLGAWKQLVTLDTMRNYLADIQRPFSNDGVYEIRIAPSLPSLFYMHTMGYLWKSVDRGDTWIKTALPKDGTMAGNATQGRVYSYKMAVDLLNSSVVYLTTFQNGGQFTLDNGSSWSPMSGLPANGDMGGGMRLGCVAIDPSSGTIGSPANRKSVVYASSSTHGLYKSVDGGATFTAVSGGPGASASINELQVSANGTVFVCVYTTSKLWRLVGSTWTDITPIGAGSSVNAICLHPTDPDTAIAFPFATSGRVTVQATAGVPASMWATLNTTVNIAYDDIPMLGSLNPSHGGVGCLAPRWDPSDTGKLWAGGGQGVIQITYPLGVFPAPVVAKSVSSGIEEIIANDVLVVPGYPAVLMAGWDVGIVRQTDLSKYSLSHVWNTGKFLSYGSALAYAPDHPNFVVASHNNTQQGNPDFGAYSLDGGATWQTMTAQPGTGLGGAIACVGDPAGAHQIIWIPGNGGRPHWSNNLGSTWTRIAGLPDDNRWNNASYYRRFNVCADPVNLGTFYLTSTNQYGVSGTFGIYKVSNNAATISLFQTLVDLGTNCRIRAWPGKAGKMLFTPGPVGSGGNDGDPATNWPHGTKLWVYDDTAQTLTDIADISGNAWTIREPWGFGFGKPKLGGTGDPVIYLYGFVAVGASPPPAGSTPAFWRSEDGGLTWAKFGEQYPLGWPVSMASVDGDPDIYGRCYVATGPVGWIYYQESSLPAPTIAWVSNAEDLTPDFNITPGGDGQWQIGDVVKFYGKGTGVYSASVTELDTVNTLDFATGVWAIGSYNVTMTMTRGGIESSPSNIVSVNLIATAPILSAPLDDGTGSTSGMGLITTNDGTGTLYAVLSISATAPTKAQVKAGQMHTGAAAAFVPASQAVAAAGVFAFSATGLTNATFYCFHFMHEDKWGNQSNVVSGDGFTTAAQSRIPRFADAQNRNFTSGFTVANKVFGAGLAVLFIYDNSGSAKTVKITSPGFADVNATLVVEDTLHHMSIWKAQTLCPTGNVVVTGSVFSTVACCCQMLFGYNAAEVVTNVAQSASVADPQKFSAPTVIPAGAVALVGIGSGASNNPQGNPAHWTQAVGDTVCEITLVALNGAQISVAHTTTTGSVDPSVSGGSAGNGYAFGGRSMVLAAWGP